MDTGTEVAPIGLGGLQASSFDGLISRYREGSATIGVVGLGYVGLPLACTAARNGFSVLGFDVDGVKVRQLENGQSYIRHIASEEISYLRDQERFAATTDFSRIAE